MRLFKLAFHDSERESRYRRRGRSISSEGTLWAAGPFRLESVAPSRAGEVGGAGYVDREAHWKLVRN